MKKYALYLFVLLISCDAFAFENSRMTTGYFQQQESKANGSVINVANVRTVALLQANPSTKTQEPVESARQNEFGTEILVYALIILIYSIYWLHNYGQVKRTSAEHKILGRDTDLNGQRSK